MTITEDVPTSAATQPIPRAVAPRAADNEAAEQPARSGHRARTVLGLAALVVILASVVYAGFWAASGGRWFIVKTPSMGQAAPVGTLLWVKPVDTVHVGDIITFRPPGLSTTYSHRVHAIAADGTITTKGDANDSTDPWRLTKSEVVGKVEMRWWGIGWLVRAAPILILGSILLWALTSRFSSDRWRLPIRIMGTSVLVSAALFWLRPLVGADQIGLFPTDPGVQATYVSTGLLPLHLSATGGGHTDLVSGQTGTVVSSLPSSSGRLTVELAPNITWWWWLVLVGVCFLPAMWTTALRSRRARKWTPRHVSMLSA